MSKKQTQAKPGPAKKTYTIGSYGTKVAAEADARDFMRPDVFVYRSAYFPNPINFGVTVKVAKAEPVKLEKPANPLYPWGIRFSVSVEGVKSANWISNLEGRLRVVQVSK